VLPSSLGRFLQLFLVGYSVGRAVLHALWVTVAQIAFYYFVAKSCYGREWAYDGAQPAPYAFVFVQFYNFSVPGKGVDGAGAYARCIIALKAKHWKFEPFEFVPDNGDGGFFWIAFSKLC